MRVKFNVTTTLAMQIKRKVGNGIKYRGHRIEPHARRFGRTRLTVQQIECLLSFLSTRVPYRYSHDDLYPAAQPQVNPYLSFLSISVGRMSEKTKYAK